VERATIFESRRQLAKIGKPVDRLEWGMTPPTVNAYYNPQMNDVNFPAGVLQPPLYDPKMDDAPTTGTPARPSPRADPRFRRRRPPVRRPRKPEGLVDAGGREEVRGEGAVRPRSVRAIHVVDDIKINSKLTSGEDVADLGGTVLAYIAWRKATAGRPLQPMDGFTPEQRFFIGLAQWACENDRPENLRVSAITNPHSPAVTGSTAWSPTCPSSSGPSPARPVSRWCARRCASVVKKKAIPAGTVSQAAHRWNRLPDKPSVQGHPRGTPSFDVERGPALEVGGVHHHVPAAAVGSAFHVLGARGLLLAIGLDRHHLHLRLGEAAEVPRQLRPHLVDGLAYSSSICSRDLGAGRVLGEAASKDLRSA